MGESLYGKFGFDAVIIGFLILIITLFVSMGFGWLIPDLFNNLKVLGFTILIIGIILAIVGIIKDDLREKAIRTLIAGICFMIVVIGLNFVIDTVISPIFENFMI